MKRHAYSAFVGISLAATSALAAPGHFTIRSLNSPDPIFVTGGDTVAIAVGATPAQALIPATVRLNGRLVTGSLDKSPSGGLTGTISGLVPGINTVEVFAAAGAQVPAARLRIAKSMPPALPCSAASFAGVALPVPNAVVKAATPVAATANVPAHCLVTGTIDEGRVGYRSSSTAPESVFTYTINWAARLPDAWNSKFFMQGGGGTNGSVPNSTGNLSLGYAAASNDSGHSNAINNDPNAAGTGSFGTDYRARTDFAYRAIDLTTRVSKALVGTYYGKAPEFSYFQGQSMGGREAMMVTQVLPDYFDGSVSGDPGFKLATMSSHNIYNAKILANLATEMGLVSSTGAPLTSNTFTNQDLQLISNAVLNACDALDGAVDGMVGNYHRCTTPLVAPKLQALACQGGKLPTCLIQGQINAILKMYAGPPGRKPDGTPIYYGWMWDAGIAGCNSPVDCNTPTATNIHTNWRGWKIGSFQNNPATAVNNASDFTSDRGGALGTAIAPTPPQMPAPLANEGLFRKLLAYDLDDYITKLFATTPEFPVNSVTQLEVDSPDRSAFKQRGGKLIIWQPQSGGPFSPLAMVDWYQKLNAFEGGNASNYKKAQDFVRLYMMPGAHHSGSGPSTSSGFGGVAFNAIVNWVENGNAPDSLIGTAATNTPWPGRTRPLCMYPSYPKYDGVGDIDSASSFNCEAEKGPR